MIGKPTVIVFGAGASASYGFPFGERLLQIIDQNLNPASDKWIPRLIECGIESEEVADFRRVLLLSQQSSVDSFLEHRPEFIRVGKLVIALSLIPAEEDSRLVSLGSRSDGCYQYIFAKMTSGARFEQFNNNQLAIITFNYDRSFERYLFSAVMNTYGKSYDECTAVLKQVPIIHVHGSLGKLPWQSSDSDEDKREYAPDTEHKELQIAANQILIVSEGQDTSEEFKKAIQYLHAAERVYFLGFGYNGTNLHRLQIAGMPPEMRGMNRPVLSRHMRGSAMGLGFSEVEQIQSEWKIFLPSTTMSCHDFLRNYAAL